ncbi:MAG: tetratricopeptide repeat protein [Chloroflexi bacterium]|nr:tetratricopeptide repeat protein [Chloroflexota bacterium]
MAKRRAVLSRSEFTTFGELLRYLRERVRLSQRELAQKVGYHYSYISRLERNSRTLDVLTLRTRFIPALRIQNEPAWVERLLELADGPNDSAEDQALVAEPARSAGRSVSRPVSLTPLLGRESESEALFQILLDEEVRLVTLIGPPGVGKTRLSIHILEQLSSMFANGAVFVDLMPVLDAGQVITALAAVLGTQETIKASALENVKSALQGSSLLIVMDNFEQVLAAAPQLLPILGAAPGVKILATSREALRLRGEQEFPLAPLAVPDEKSQSVLDFPSVQLFMQRAHSAKPDFQLDEEDASRAAEICRRLDGLPLAIELAAARIRTFSPADMLEQFDRRFQWLAHTSRDMPEWRRTLWSTIEWSYNLLSEKERALFERLSVFTGGWTIEAAEALCSDGKFFPQTETLTILMQLVGKSLVASETGGRYRFLDTIEKFAHEKLIESGGLEEMNNSHLRYFADWAEALEAQFNTITPLIFQSRAAPELTNIRAALEWALHHREAFVDGLRLSIPTSLIWLELGQIRDEYERARIFLRGITDPALQPLQVRLLLRTAALGFRIESGGIPYEDCLNAERIARSLNDMKLLADVLFALGDMDRELRRFDSADKYLTECVAMYRELNLLAELNHSLSSMGNNLYHLGRFAGSRAALDEALEIAIQISDPTGLGSALRVRATNLRYDGKYLEALEAFKSALDVARTNGDRPNVAINLANLCVLANLLEDYPASADYAEAAIMVFQSLGNRDQQAFPKRMLAYALLQQGFSARAKVYALESLHINLEAGTRGMGTLPSLLALAEIELAEGNLETPARIYGFLKPQLEGKFLVVNPDSRSFDRVGCKLVGKGTEAWQIEGASMLLDEAVISFDGSSSASP